MVTTAPAVLNPDVTKQFTFSLTFGEQKVTYYILPGGDVNYLDQKVILDRFQKPPGPLTSHCATFPADVRVIEVPQQYDSL